MASSRFALFASLAAVAVLAAESASAAIDSAEICTSHDGRQRIARPFGETKAIFSETGRDPRVRPEVKEDHSYTKDPVGLSTKSAVDKEMFELMAEPFGGTAQPKEKWVTTFEASYEGKVKVFDDLGKHVGTFLMSCNSAIVEY